MPAKVIGVRLVDEKGRTLARFRKETHFDKAMRPESTTAWSAASKPLSDNFLDSDKLASAQRLPGIPVRTVNGRRYLRLPGLTLRWEKVTAALDRLAVTRGLLDPKTGQVAVALDESTTLTTQQLRQLVVA